MNSVDYKGSTPLHLAAWAGNLEIVRILLNHRSVALDDQMADKQAEQQSSSSSNSCSPNNQGGSRHATLIDVDACNNDNQTPLSLAAQFGHNEVVAELLAHSANVHLRNNQLESPLDLACLNGRYETIKLILNSSPMLIAELRRPKSIIYVNNNLQDQAIEQCQQTMSNLQQQHASKQAVASSGWSSLLRGRRDSGSNQTSPLSRFNQINLSMRQTNQAGNDDRDKRRATLTISAPLPANFNLLNKQLSLTENHLGVNEKLLEHSPLHYAVRKGHINVVQLLLFQYNSNIYQLTSLGSILHEVAMSNCLTRTICNEMLNLIFTYLCNSIHSSSNNDPMRSIDSKVQDRLNRFLNLKNLQQNNVFELLNDINNRSAHEIKRLIYEYSEQQLAIANSGNMKRPDQFGINKLIAHQSMDLPNPSQQHRLQQQFSESQHLNSFVTMKRAPKHQQQYDARQPLRSQDPNMFMPGDSQTIGRRSSARAPISSQLWQYNQPSQSQQQFPAMTRSVSNLNQPLVQQQHQQQRPAQLTHDQLLWQQWLANNAKQPDERENCANGQGSSSGKRRSKSRDLGSILMEAQNQENLRNIAQCYSPFDNITKQQPPAHSEQNNLANLVRSQTDCSHLMGRFFGDNHSNFPNELMDNPLNVSQQQPLQHKTLDRKMINRHYHVYEHEFYPPRLLPANQQNHDGQPRQVAPIRPLNRVNSLDEPHRVSGSFSLESNQNELGQQQTIHEMQPDSRLNLNMMQKQQMDRFAGKSGPRSKQQVRCSSVDQKRRDLIELQKRLMFEQESADNAGQQAAALPQSFSLESHLSEPHLFETTRKALMKDFDKMIGQELLNRNHQQIITTANKQSASQQSILTGVMLDMDRYGERLTVSGTRILLPNDDQQEQVNNSSRLSTSSCNSSLLLNNTDQQSTTCITSPLSISSHGTQTSETDLSLTTAPKKPPRPSLDNKKKPAAIYDVPDRQENDCGKHIASNVDNSHCSKRTSERIQKLSAQFSSTSSASTSSSNKQISHSRISLTEPPKVKPPPPPIKVLHSPLQVNASSINHNDSQQPPSLTSSSGSSVASSAATATSMSQEFGAGLLKMASSSSNNSSIRSNQSNATTTNSGKNANILMDTDSGVCTSNSPASNGQDSEGLNESLPTIGDVCVNSSQPPPRPSLPIFIGSSLKVNTTRSSTLSDQPPSPKTAQLCIEEALMPLTKVSL